MLERIKADLTAAMRAREKERIAVFRMILAAVKQKEVDERIELDDTAVLSVLDKMQKQRRESLAQYESAGREDLAEVERFELSLLQAYLPEPLDEEAIEALITQAMEELSATGMKDMGRVVAHLKPTLQGRADMSQVSKKIKTVLSTTS